MLDQKYIIVHVASGLILDMIEMSDLPDLVRQLNDEELYNNTLTVPFPYTAEHAASFIEHVHGFLDREGILKDYAIRLDGKLIGGIGALYNFGLQSHKSEIGYWMSRDHRGSGIMTKVISAFTEHLFQSTRLIRLEANVFVGNYSSARVLEKNGFLHEGTLQAAFVKDGKPKDSWLYAKIKSQ